MSKFTAMFIVALMAAGAGAFGRREHGRLAQEQRSLASAREQVTNAADEVRAAKEHAAALRKDLDEQRGQVNQLRIDRDAAKALFEAENRRGERLQADLNLMREQLAFLKARQVVESPSPATTARPPPFEVRAVPAARTAVPAPAPAARVQHSRPDAGGAR